MDYLVIIQKSRNYPVLVMSTTHEIRRGGATISLILFKRQDIIWTINKDYQMQKGIPPFLNMGLQSEVLRASCQLALSAQKEAELKLKIGSPTPPC